MAELSTSHPLVWIDCEESSYQRTLLHASWLTESHSYR